MSQGRQINMVIGTVRREGALAVIPIRGEIDLHNSPELRRELLRLLEDKTVTRLVLNLTEVPYMDSSAIAVLVEALQKIRRLSGKIFLSNLQPRVKGLLEIARLDSIFCIVTTEADALKP